MEKKINIAELLKDCPKGMELDCMMYENVTLASVSNNRDYPIKIETPDGQISLNRYGCYSSTEHAKCVIFPKGKTTWEGFVPPCKFKVGDKIVKRNSISNSWIVTSVSSEYYGLKSPEGSESIGVLTVSGQDDYELISNKFDITTLKPFDKVLVRDCAGDKWVIEFFSHTQDFVYMFVCHRDNWGQCIPYEGNEHLLNTTQDCEDFYITWNN